MRDNIGNLLLPREHVTLYKGGRDRVRTPSRAWRRWGGREVVALQPLSAPLHGQGEGRGRQKQTRGEENSPDDASITEIRISITSFLCSHGPDNFVLAVEKNCNGIRGGEEKKTQLLFWTAQCSKNKTKT